MAKTCTTCAHMGVTSNLPPCNTCLVFNPDKPGATDNWQAIDGGAQPIIHHERVKAGACEKHNAVFLSDECPHCAAEKLLPGGILKASSALDVQIGGSHYKGMKIQPAEFIHANGIGYFEGAVIKYVSRWRAKNGIEDLKKAQHYIALLVELEEAAAK